MPSPTGSARGELARRGRPDGLVDEVWDRMAFRTPWSGEREREAVRDALSRFVAWQSRPGARTTARVRGPDRRRRSTFPTGSRCACIGYVDRLELDEDGGVVVVDLKTGKYAPTDTCGRPTTPSSASTSSPSTTAPPTRRSVDPCARRGRAGAAAARVSELPKVQPQAPQTPDADGVTLIEHQLMPAVAAVRAEEFVARPGPHCDRCEFHAVCPAQSSGSVLS